MRKEEKNFISGIWKDNSMEKIKTLLTGLVPGVVFILAQSIIVLCFDTVCWLIAAALANVGIAPSGFLETMEREGSYLIGIIGDGIFLIFGFLWYRRLFWYVRQEEGKKVLGVKALLFLLVSGAALQFATDVILTWMQVFLPRMMESYGQVMESLGMTSPSICSVLYTVVFAPVAEELAFRGLTMRILRREFSFWTANLIQALFFALMHGNLVQGLYALAAGMFLGWLLRRYGSLKAPVLCHFAVNLSGALMGFFPFGVLGLTAGAVILAAVAVVLGYSEEKR